MTTQTLTAHRTPTVRHPAPRSATVQALRAWAAASYIGAIGAGLLTAMVLFCVFAPFVLPSPTHIDVHALGAQAPSTRHLLGTDTIGRDVLARLASAGRSSLGIGLSVALGATILGAVIGMIAGYLGGWIDAVTMWVVDALSAIPTLPLLIAMGAVVAQPGAFGHALGALPSQVRIALILTCFGWMPVARIARARAAAIRGCEYEQAALAMGAGRRRILLIHVAPQLRRALAVFATLTVANAILAETAISFLGVGVQPPTATWGTMLEETRDMFTLMNYPWLVWPVVVAIAISVVGVGMLGERFRALNADGGPG